LFQSKSEKKSKRQEHTAEFLDAVTALLVASFVAKPIVFPRPFKGFPSRVGQDLSSQHSCDHQFFNRRLRPPGGEFGLAPNFKFRLC
jgi:hypothetical protein